MVPAPPAALLLLLPAAPAPPPPGAPGHREFAELAERWRAAYNGGKVQALAPFYAADAQYISAHVAGLVAQGREGVLAYFETGMKAGGHLVRLSVLSVTRRGDLANVLCAYEADNAGQKARGRTLLLLRRMDGAWRIYLHMTVV